MTNTPDRTLVPVEQVEGCFCASMREEGYREVCPHCIATKDWTLKPTPVEADALASSSTPIPVSGEVLRAALIQCGRAAGCFLADDVSDDFLMLVPAEVEARLAALNHTPTSDQGERADEAPTSAGDEARELVHNAYVQGATDVHNEWMREGVLPRTEYPEFGEAADDYVASLDLTAPASTQPAPPTSDQGEARARDAAITAVETKEADEASL